MVAWNYEDIVEETVGWFCMRALPDAGNWSDCCYRLSEIAPDTPRGRSWRVEIDIPTGEAMDCWLSFEISSPDEGDMERSFVRNISAVRSGRGKHEYETYSWRDDEGMWVLLPEEDWE